MKNKIYGFNIDMLRVCFESNNPELIRHLSSFEIGEKCDFYEFYLLRIDGRFYDYVFQIRYDELGEDKLFGELRFGLNNSDKDANTHANGLLKVWIYVANRVLYCDEIHYLGYISDVLDLEYHNITSLDLCLDMSRDIAKYLKRLIQCTDLDVILNGKKILDRKHDRPEITYVYSGNLDKQLKYLTLKIRQKNAIKDKNHGLSLIAYNKKNEIENSSAKNYISDLYGDPKKLYRLEVHLNNDELKEYFDREKVEVNLGIIYNQEFLFRMFCLTLERLIRFKQGDKKIEWWDVLRGTIKTTPAKASKSKLNPMKTAG